MKAEDADLAFIREINQAPQESIQIICTGKEVVYLPLHRHPMHQLIYTSMGTLHLKAWKEQYFLPEGHIAWIPAEMPHQLDTHNHQISLLIVYFYMGETVCPDDLKNSFHIYRGNRFLLENLHFITSKEKLILKEKDPELYGYMIAFLRLLPLIAQSSGLPLQGLVIPDDKRLGPVLEYLSMHCRDDLHLPAVAAQFGYTERNLSRLFKKADMGFSSFLNHQRIIKAMELLSDKTHTIQEIAYLSGFSTPNNFDRVFRKVVGMTPKVFSTDR